MRMSQLYVVLNSQKEVYVMVLLSIVLSHVDSKETFVMDSHASCLSVVWLDHLHHVHLSFACPCCLASQHCIILHPHFHNSKIQLLKIG